MKIYVLPPKMVDALRSWFHPKDRSVILAPATFIEGEEIVTPAHPTAPGNPAHNRGRLYWKNGCWTQLDESGNEAALCAGEWQSWAPTLTQSGAVTFTIALARYKDDGSTIDVRMRLNVTGAGVAGNAIVVGGLPVAIADVTGIAGVIRIVDASVAHYVGALVVNTATSFTGRAHNTTLGVIGVDPSFALANGDIIDISGTYER